MEYSKQDFLEIAGPQTLKQIAKTRGLTRKYNQIEHSDTKARTALLQELFGAIGENVEIDTPFYCDYGKNIFIGSDVIININCTFVDNRPIYIGNRACEEKSVIKIFYDNDWGWRLVSELSAFMGVSQSLCKPSN